LEVSCQLHASAASPPRKEPPVPIAYKVRWTPESVWTTWRRENPWPYRDSNSGPSIVQPAASHTTNYAIPAPNWSLETRVCLKCWLWSLRTSDYIIPPAWRNIRNILIACKVMMFSQGWRFILWPSGTT
jgi:hypothetical protein